MRLFTASPSYAQGPGLLDQLGKLVGNLGVSAVAVIDGEVRRMLESRIQQSFASAGTHVTFLTMTQDVTHAAIAALAADAQHLGADVILGIGGGKALDTGKGVALKLRLPFVSVPTIASNDAPASGVIAVYDDHHSLAEVAQMPHGPDLVVVDSAIIAAAPPRFLRAGIGDALAKTFEAQACLAGGGSTIRGTRPSQAGLAIAEACYQLLRRHAVQALTQVAEGKAGDDLEAVLEASILLSALGFENGGLSVAHAVARGLSGIREAAAALHGEHVAYGLLVQLILEERSTEFLDDLLGFYRQVELPSSLGQIGFSNDTARSIGEIAAATMRGPNVRNFQRVLSATDLEQAMQAVERLSSEINV